MCTYSPGYSRAGEGIGFPTMKMLAEYLDKAINFEQMAAGEPDPTLKASLLAQATAYRKLATDRANRDGLSPPAGSR
jgi:hypothetical protein